MAYTPPTRVGTREERTVFAAAQDHLPKRLAWPKNFTEAHDRFEEATARLVRAHHMVAAGRGLLKEWEAEKAKWEDAQAEKVGPEDFVPYAEPMPSEDFLLSVARTFERARQRAGRALTLAAPSIWPTLETAWIHHSAPVPDSVTVAEARVAEAVKVEALRALGNAGLAVLNALSATEVEVKRYRLALAEGRLVSLKTIRDTMSGAAQRNAQEAKAQEAKAAQKAADSAYATEAAKARMAGAKGAK